MTVPGNHAVPVPGNHAVTVPGIIQYRGIILYGGIILYMKTLRNHAFIENHAVIEESWRNHAVIEESWDIREVPWDIVEYRGTMEVSCCRYCTWTPVLCYRCTGVRHGTPTVPHRPDRQFERSSNRIKRNIPKISCYFLLLLSWISCCAIPHSPMLSNSQEYPKVHTLLTIYDSLLFPLGDPNLIPPNLQCIRSTSSVGLPII